MERHDTIQRLKHGEFPSGFAERLQVSFRTVSGTPCAHDTLSSAASDFRSITESVENTLGDPQTAVQDCIRNMLSQGKAEVTVQSLKKRWLSIQTSIQKFDQ